MNKLLIVLLAVCLFSVVSAHTFVKRDIPTADEVKAQVTAFAGNVTELGTNITKKIADSMKPEEIKQTFNNAVDAVSKVIENLKPAATDTSTKPAAE